jgi:hypothetical protein
MGTTIEPASRTDLLSILALVKACRLPTAWMGEHLGTAMVARERGKVVGSAELEL